MRLAKHAFIAIACLSSVEVAGVLQHNVACAQVTGTAASVSPLSARPVPQAAHVTGVVNPTGRVAAHAPISRTSNSSTPVSQPSASATLLNSRSFSIPFTVDASGTQPAKVQLFVARHHSAQPGAGIQWELFDEAQPEAKQFEFTAPGDGLYFFTTRTIDVTGRPHPVGNTLEVVINTAGPDIKLDADTDASGRVDLSYVIQDASPVTEVQLQYMTDVERVWRPIDTANVAPAAKVSFTPSGAWDQISVQATVVDAAGNRKTMRRLVQRPRVAVVPTNRFSSTGVDSPTARPAPYRIPGSEQHSQSSPFPPQLVGQPVQWSGQSPPSTTNSSGGVTVTAVPSGAVPSGTGSSEPPRGFESIPLPTGTPIEASADHGATGLGLEPPLQGSMFGNPTANSPNQSITPWNAVASPPKMDAQSTRPRTPAEAMRPLDDSMRESIGNATSDGQIPSTGMPVPSASNFGSAELEQIPLSEEITKDAKYAAERAAESLPVQTVIDSRVPLRYSESARFSLEYELEAVGSGGVEAVELWGSLDGGSTWKRWGSDPDRQSPFDIETNGEGTYAYRIVVVSSSGLASPRPLAGEIADIAVIVDSTKPVVKITGAKYGEGDRVGSLVIKYACDDTNLLPRPIALAFSETLDGPWTTIASGLRNDGEYVWPADPQLPRQFYLRIDSTDAAGNVGSNVLDQPIDAQGLAPRARIRGLQSLTGSTPPAATDQTATLPAGAFK